MGNFSNLLNWLKANKQLVFILLFCIVSYLVLSYHGGGLDRRIAKIEAEKQKTLDSSQALQRQIDSLKQTITGSTAEIQALHRANDYYLNQIAYISGQIIKLDKKYAKAASYADHYNTDSIRQYFSNLR